MVSPQIEDGVRSHSTRATSDHALDYSLHGNFTRHNPARPSTGAHWHFYRARGLTVDLLRGQKDGCYHWHGRVSWHRRQTIELLKLLSYTAVMVVFITGNG